MSRQKTILFACGTGIATSTAVNVAVTEMERTTQQNAAMVEQSTAAARSLTDEAAQLSRMVARFELGEEEWSNTAIPAPAPAYARAMPARSRIHGNLALKVEEPDGEWTDF
jgi:methyl-accepting chemotaxis protein